jgi:hypothetical protein
MGVRGWISGAHEARRPMMDEQSGSSRDLTRSYVPVLAAVAMIAGSFTVGAYWSDLNSRIARIENSLSWIMERMRTKPEPKLPLNKQPPSPPAQARAG